MRWKLVSAGVTLTSLCLAIPFVSEEVPIERLLRNLSRYMREHPTDAEGYYLLARLHSSAFLFGETRRLPVATPYKDEKAESAPPQLLHHGPSLRSRELPNGVLTEQDKLHLSESLRHYRIAVTLDPGNALAWLGLGYM